MKAPLIFELSTPIRQGTSLKKRRSTQSGNRVQYAKYKLICSRQINLLRQFFNGFTFYLEWITYYVKEPVNIKLKAEQSCLMFIYAINSDLNFSMPGNVEFMIIPKGYGFAHLLPAGEYQWEIESGTRKFVYFILRPDWMQSVKADYPELEEVIESLENGDATNHVFQPHFMTENTIRQVEKLRDCKLKGKVELEEILLHIINKLIAEYHTHLTAPKGIFNKSNQQIIFEVRDYIIEAVSKGLIPNVSEISALFNMEPKALRRNCQKIFKMNLKDLIIDAQMKLAHPLLKSGLKVKEVSAVLGYSEQTNFSRSYKRYFGYAPSNITHEHLEKVCR